MGGIEGATGSLIERFERARRDGRHAVLEGFHPLKHALRFGADIREAYTPDPEQLQALAQALAPDIAPWVSAYVRPVERALFQRLAPVPPETGVIAIAARPEVELTSMLQQAGDAPIVLLESPAHLGNVGAVVRVAAAAGAAAVLTTGTRDPWHPAALRGSAGLHFALPVARIEALPPTDCPLIAFHPEGAPLGPSGIPAGAILAFGTERGGLGPALLERASERVAIPMRAGVSSLNLATAAAVALYAWRLSAVATASPGPSIRLDSGS